MHLKLHEFTLIVFYYWFDGDVALDVDFSAFNPQASGAKRPHGEHNVHGGRKIFVRFEGT